MRFILFLQKIDGKDIFKVSGDKHKDREDKERFPQRDIFESREEKEGRPTLEAYIRRVESRSARDPKN